jgi:hypothetical protein
VENPRVVAMVNGLTTLLDVVLEPASQDMAEPILMSLLYLLNDPKSRYEDVYYYFLFLFCNLLFILVNGKIFLYTTMFFSSFFTTC